MLRVVIDTPVVVAAFLGPGRSAANELLEAHRRGDFERVSSPRLFAELDGVLRRPALAELAAGGRAGAFADRIASATLFVEDPYDPPRTTPSRHHDQLVSVARAGGARFVISSEPDLLRSFVRGVTIATPEEFLEALQRVAPPRRADQ